MVLTASVCGWATSAIGAARILARPLTPTRYYGVPAGPKEVGRVSLVTFLPRSKKVTGPPGPVPAKRSDITRRGIRKRLAEYARSALYPIRSKESGFGGICTIAYSPASDMLPMRKSQKGPVSAIFLPAWFLFVDEGGYAFMGLGAISLLRRPRGGINGQLLATRLAGDMA